VLGCGTGGSAVAVFEEPTPANEMVEKTAQSNTSAATFEKREIVMGKPPEKLREVKQSGCWWERVSPRKPAVGKEFSRSETRASSDACKVGYPTRGGRILENSD
jgi:hypothetical protein